MATVVMLICLCTTSNDHTRPTQRHTGYRNDASQVFQFVQQTV